MASGVASTGVLLDLFRALIPAALIGTFCYGLWRLTRLTVVVIGKWKRRFHPAPADSGGGSADGGGVA